MPGRILKEFIRGSDLAHVDSRQLCRCRGTWRHPGTGGYYDLDSFLISRSDLHAVNHDLTTSSGVADHLGKSVSLHVGSFECREKRVKRRRYWRAVRARRGYVFRTFGVLAPPLWRLVQGLALLQALSVSQPPDSQVRNEVDGVCEGWEEKAPRVWHAY